MQSASSAFTNTLRFGDYLVLARITVYSGGAPTTYQVPVSEAAFTIDRNSAQRRQGSITVEVVPSVPPPPLMPTGPESLLAPFGNEVFVECATIPPGGNLLLAEWIPLGMFAIATTTTVDSTIDVIVQLDLYDRSWVISQRKLLAPYSVPATSSGNFVAEVQALCNMVWSESSNMPPLQYNITPTDYVVPAGTYNQGQDPWQAALDMALSAGYELFFDVHGVLTGYPIPNPTTQPVRWVFNQNSVSATGALNPPNSYDYKLANTPWSTPAAVTVTMTRDGIPNDFWVSATGPNNGGGTGYNAAPVQARAADTNPNSPTYIGGGMGDVPQFVQDSLITSQAQALAEAQYDLAQALAKSFIIQVSSTPNPLFDIDDVFGVVDPRLGLNGQNVVIDTINFSVRYDTLTTLQGRVIA